MRSRLPHKRDSNHAEIARTFEQLGCTVFDTSAVGGDFPDMIVGCAGRNLLIEAKSEMHDLNVMRPLSKACIAKLRAMPRTIRSGPKRELPKMVRTMIGGGR